ncbi:hypothetical protein SO802_025964 [Lithocarpus litseifolius]|uniref:hAT-like transposase RNase-H fold domain-containing protein n=1 Tax=Lithocarpus litseifolius TaxID=425828 RepID=A0AAW2C1T5_9ROSI
MSMTISHSLIIQNLTLNLSLRSLYSQSNLSSLSSLNLSLRSLFYQSRVSSLNLYSIPFTIHTPFQTLAVAAATSSLQSRLRLTFHHGLSLLMLTDQLLSLKTLSDAPPSQTTPTAQAKPIAQVLPTATPTNAEVPPFPPKANSKGHGTANLLNHTPVCVKNPNGDTLKGQQILAFKPKMDEEEWFQLISIAFTVEASRKDIPSHQIVARGMIGIYGVEKEKLSGALTGRRVREAVRYVKSSPNRNQTFISFVERLGIESKSLLCLDVPIRWNSTYIMLETAQKFEKVFIRMDFEDDSYSSYFMNKENSGGMRSPSGIDFQNCRTFVGFLKLFYSATKKFSGSLYVTANTFFDEMFVIQENISHLSKSQNQLLKNMATKMESKFDKYWGKDDKINHLLYVVVVLDPRKKLRFLKFCFSEIYGNEVADVMVELVRGSLVKLYNYYSCVDSPNVQVPSGSERTHIEGESIGCSDLYTIVNSRFDRFLEAEQSIGCSNEIDKYLAENCESRRGDVKFEILGW